MSGAETAELGMSGTGRDGTGEVWTPVAFAEAGRIEPAEPIASPGPFF